jgi:hypothetical protein
MEYSRRGESSHHGVNKQPDPLYVGPRTAEGDHGMSIFSSSAASLRWISEEENATIQS